MILLGDVNWTTIIPVIGVIVAPILTFIIATRRMSGKVNTTEASELWDEARDIRNDYRDRLEMANDRTREVEKRLAEVERHNNSLVGENLMLQGKIRDCEDLGRRLLATISQMEKTIDMQAKALEALQ